MNAYCVQLDSLNMINELFRHWEIDFEILYPDKTNNLFLKLKTFYKMLLKIFDFEIKDRASRGYYA